MRYDKHKNSGLSRYRNYRGRHCRSFWRVDKRHDYAYHFYGIIVAGVFHRSGKSENGALESRAGFKGLCRKGMILLILLVACRLDLMLGTGYIKDCVCIAFVVNETLSIIENAGLMGVPIPQVLIKAIDVLKAKEEK